MNLYIVKCEALHVNSFLMKENLLMTEMEQCGFLKILMFLFLVLFFYTIHFLCFWLNSI